MAKRRSRARPRGKKGGSIRSCLTTLSAMIGVGVYLFYTAYEYIGVPADAKARIFAAYADLGLEPRTIERMRESPLPPSEKPANTPWRTIGRVIDGDTLEIDGVKVRLIGVDTPESSENNELYRDVGKMGGIAKPHELAAMGKEATRHLRKLAEGKRCWLEYESETVDQYGRPLAYVHLEDGSILNEALLLDGYAKVYMSFQFKYRKRYIYLQMAAMARRNGFWAGEE